MVYKELSIAMTGQEKLRLDIEDFWRVHDGLEVYAGLGVMEIMERLRSHQEDALCSLVDLKGTGELECTRDATEAIYSIADRHLAFLPVPDDYSVEELTEAIRKYFVRAMVLAKTDEGTLSKCFELAEADLRSGFLERIYHFPCVLFHFPKPRQFRIGSVAFTPAGWFPKFRAGAFEAYLKFGGNTELNAKIIEEFNHYSASAGWVVTVVVPPCTESASYRRADMAVTTAVNLLRLFMGVGYARSIRPAHAPQSIPRQTSYAVESNWKMNFISSRRMETALVSEEWYLMMNQNKWFWKAGESLLDSAVLGARPEIANRLIDALRWFGEAAFEGAPGTQLAKFVFALERMVMTERYSREITHNFCSRVAFLVCREKEDFDSYYWQANGIYVARSDVVHGRVSSAGGETRKNLRLAHDFTQRALIGLLGLQHAMKCSGAKGTLADLVKFFRAHEAARRATLERLRGGRERKAKA